MPHAGVMNVDRGDPLLTVIACQVPPRAVGTPRLFSASAIPPRVVTRGADTLDYRRHFGREAIGGSDDLLPALRGSLGRVARVTQLCTLRLLAGERLAGPLRDQLALLLGEAGVQVEDERIDIGAELGHHKRDAVRHQPADEVHIPAQPVELGDHDRALGAPRRGERAGEFGATIQRAGPSPVSTYGRRNISAVALSVTLHFMGDARRRLLRNAEFPVHSHPPAQLSSQTSSMRQPL